MCGANKAAIAVASATTPNEPAVALSQTGRNRGITMARVSDFDLFGNPSGREGAVDCPLVRPLFYACEVWNAPLTVHNCTR